MESERKNLIGYYVCLFVSPVYNDLIRCAPPGTQFKTIVEYAPSQRVPRQWSKKDGREGTIFKGTKMVTLFTDCVLHLCQNFLICSHNYFLDEFQIQNMWSSLSFLQSQLRIFPVQRYSWKEGKRNELVSLIFRTM